MTLKFNWVLEVVEVHVHAKFQQAKSSGSWENTANNTVCSYRGQ